MVNAVNTPSFVAPRLLRDVGHLVGFWKDILT